MDMPDITINLDHEQARLLFELVQRDIQASQRAMCQHPELREPKRHRIILGQAIRRQIPESYWR